MEGAGVLLANRGRPGPAPALTAGDAGIAPLRRVYDLRHTFATLALRAGISTFDLSRHLSENDMLNWHDVRAGRLTPYEKRAIRAAEAKVRGA